MAVRPVISLKDFDFEFPEELIATHPAEPRDSSRLMAIDRRSGDWRHLRFRDLPSLLSSGDCVVLNRTKVFAARLLGKKSTGGKADLLLVREMSPGLWAALSSGLKKGQRLLFPGGAEASVEGLTDEGEYLCRFNRTDLIGYLSEFGKPPLPPYILKKRTEEAADDLARYQTVFARDTGSIAAPTAGLHFTDELISSLKAKGIAFAYVTLHVGRGTFRPIDADDASRHRMLPEWCRMEEADAALVRTAKRVVSVGTTSTRTLESLARRPEGFGAGELNTDLYIHPGFEFKVLGGLITNFHLPRSTPLMLASAFLGREKLLAAYQEAFKERYRLYSYGDAMVIL